MVKQYEIIISIFFFFQAEDGIRDYKVTGVQTCALPIYALADVRDIRQIVLADDIARLNKAADRWTDRVSDRKSTRLNSSHLVISYAVFCLKKNKCLQRILA